MIYQLYSVQDIRAGCYFQPYMFRNEGEALRTFEELANNPGSMICKYAEDYRMCLVGSFDDETGEVFGGDALVVAAAEQVRKDGPLEKPRMRVAAGKDQ